MSETTEQSIGDNSLIKTLLATRIAETPTKKVDEVEIPEPEIIEAEHIEILKKTEAPEPQPVDYTEYDEEPAKIQKDIPLSAEKPNLPAEISEDKKAKQRKISSRWGVRLYDKFGKGLRRQNFRKRTRRTQRSQRHCGRFYESSNDLSRIRSHEQRIGRGHQRNARRTPGTNRHEHQSNLDFGNSATDPTGDEFGDFNDP